MQEPTIIDGEFEEVGEKTVVNVGTVGHCDHGTNVSVNEYTAIDHTEYPNESSAEPETPRSRGELLVMLEDAYENGHVTKVQYKKMRRDLGIVSSSKKKITPTKRKSKRAAAKKARRKQRK